MLDKAHDNGEYHGLSTNAISNSKVGDFLISKEYYFKRYVTQELKVEPTKPMKFGSLVDALLFNTQLPYSVKVLKRDDPELFDVQKTMDKSKFVTKDFMASAKEAAAYVERQPFWHWYTRKPKNVMFQADLQGTYNNTPICGRPDIVAKVGKKYYIDDLKVTSALNVISPKKWYYKCKKMGYFRQLGAYAYMLSQQTGCSIHDISFRHICVYKTSRGTFKVKLFEVPKELPLLDLDVFLSVAEQIYHCKDFTDAPVTWDDLEIMYEVDSE